MANTPESTIYAVATPWLQLRLTYLSERKLEIDTASSDLRTETSCANDGKSVKVQVASKCIDNYTA